MQQNGICDTDGRFIIDPFTGLILPQGDVKTTLVRNNHKSERITFVIPRYVEGHDMSVCEIEVHYTNKQDEENISKDLHPVSDAQIIPDTDEVAFSWLIHGNATKYAGSLVFSVKFKFEDYEWNTQDFSLMSVVNSQNNSDEIAEEYSDVLGEWKGEIDSRFDEIEDAVAETMESTHIKQFSSLEQIGITGAVTMGDVFRAMPDDSKLTFVASNKQITDLPAPGNHTFEVFKDALRYGIVTIKEAETTSPKAYHGAWVSRDGFLGWERIATESDLSDVVREKEWELIEEVTLAEAVSTYIAPMPQNKYKEVYIEAVLKVQTGQTSNKNVRFNIGRYQNVMSAVDKSMADGGTAYVRIHGWHSPSLDEVYDFTLSGYKYIQGDHQRNAGSSVKTALKHFNDVRFWIDSGYLLDQGSTFSVWGR